MSEYSFRFVLTDDSEYETVLSEGFSKYDGNRVLAPIKFKVKYISLKKISIKKINDKVLNIIYHKSHHHLFLTLKMIRM